MIYISGPMTGLPAFNHPAFHAAAMSLRDQGLDVMNPAELDKTPDAPWHEHLRRDIAALMYCDSIYMLPGWMNSKGARLERHIAIELGMNVMYAGVAE